MGAAVKPWQAREERGVHVKNPEKILDIFKTRSDEAARIIAELRERRDLALKAQVSTLQSIETAWDTARRDRSLASSASGYAQSALKKAGELRYEVERIADAEVTARDQLLDRFADQKRFEVYLAQRQIKQRQIERKREEKRLLEEIEALRGAREREERG